MTIKYVLSYQFVCHYAKSGEERKFFDTYAPDNRPRTSMIRTM